jgi:DeoR family fructose operon transcriptional repressor
MSYSDNADLAGTIFQLRAQTLPADVLAAARRSERSGHRTVRCGHDSVNRMERVLAGYDPHSRRSDLLSRIRSDGQLVVRGLPALLGVSAETIRRDLRALESRGLIRRAYGVAYPVESSAFESTLEVRSSINPEEKVRVANAVIPRLGDVQTIFIDEGYQMQLVAQRMPLDQALTIVTSSLAVATTLAARANIQVIVLGGRVRGSTLGVVDDWPTRMLSRLVIDLAIIGANGITLEHGMTTPDPAVAAVKAEAVRASRRRVFIGAHHKFGRTTFARFADVQDFELLITGHELSTSLASRYASAGVSLLRV